MLHQGRASGWPPLAPASQIPVVTVIVSSSPAARVQRLLLLDSQHNRRVPSWIEAVCVARCCVRRKHFDTQQKAAADVVDKKPDTALLEPLPMLRESPSNVEHQHLNSVFIVCAITHCHTHPAMFSVAPKLTNPEETAERERLTRGEDVTHCAATRSAQSSAKEVESRGDISQRKEKFPCCCIVLQYTQYNALSKPLAPASLPKCSTVHLILQSCVQGEVGVVQGLAGGRPHEGLPVQQTQQQPHGSKVVHAHTWQARQKHAVRQLSLNRTSFEAAACLSGRVP